jgi:hypothetical protein
VRGQPGVAVAYLVQHQRVMGQRRAVIRRQHEQRYVYVKCFLYVFLKRRAQRLQHRRDVDAFLDRGLGDVEVAAATRI